MTQTRKLRPADEIMREEQEGLTQAEAAFIMRYSSKIVKYDPSVRNNEGKVLAENHVFISESWFD